MTAFAHGFVSMELSGAFRLGGDVDEAFSHGGDTLVDAIARKTQRGSDGHRAPGIEAGRPST